ncbi:hypothetical protein FZEAL_5808 [Fusarium zealandicum]|uniref:Uncharacterized protein n=1 Tax=Fusarium zealandicum TaxID=1053134 RepID=A0A8H4UJT3_9HYPO|nr:hypothetical protein FZEAL_5808 [Fusarium zealandicum]
MAVTRFIPIVSTTLEHVSDRAPLLAVALTLEIPARLRNCTAAPWLSPVSRDTSGAQSKSLSLRTTQSPSFNVPGFSRVSLRPVKRPASEADCSEAMGQPQVHRAANLAMASPGPAASRDVHFIDTSSGSPSIPSFSSASKAMLQELSADQVHNTSLAWNSPRRCQEDQPLQYSTSVIQDPNASLFKHRVSLSRGLRRRSPIEPDAFEPLDVVVEESTTLSATSIAASDSSRHSTPNASVNERLSPKARVADIHPLTDAKPTDSIPKQYEKLLAGQFEWVLSCPAPARNVQNHDSPDDDEAGRRNKGIVVYGCNLLSREQRSSYPDALSEFPQADTFALIATPLKLDECSDFGIDFSQALGDNFNMTEAPPPIYEFRQTNPLKVPEVVEVVEQAVSPSLTVTSERSSSYAGSSRNGSFSVPRIEDSLAELDKLEDDLEAINAVTHTRRMDSPQVSQTRSNHLEPPAASIRQTLTKRASIAGMSATVRVKQPDRSQPALRRSTSLVFRDRKQDELAGSPKLRSQPSRGKLASAQPTPLKAPVKSSKPPTVPKFELPGEAVARRLKEQREARLAQQTDAPKAYVPVQIPKSSRPLTKPNFELPGETISRRKREQREARLKAQEEEDQKKREFRARPVRTSIVPSIMPRENVASLARQGKLPQEDVETRQSETAKSKRLSVADSRPTPASGSKAGQFRGRLSTATSREDLSRGTSTSGGSANGKRATLTAEEAHQLKRRGKEIFQRDNSRFTQDREREKREREAATRLAREQAAERSRIASREWAEKKRRKEQASREVLRA